MFFKIYEEEVNKKKNVDNSVKKLTILEVFGLTSKISHHSILLTNKNILRFFFVYSILGYLL